MNARLMFVFVIYIAWIMMLVCVRYLELDNTPKKEEWFNIVFFTNTAISLTWLLIIATDMEVIIWK